MKKVAFIGVGVMGSHMVRNLMKNGVTVYLYSRTKEKVQELLNEGAIWCDSIAECIRENNIVITMLGFPGDVEEVYLREYGIIANGQPGTYLIDMTTTVPHLAVTIAKEAEKRGMHFLDAPVSGSDIRAEEGTLTIMVGGESDDFKRCYPVFQCMGNKIIHQGPVGSGQNTKMANQIAIAGAISGVCEALYYAEKAGLDQTKTLITISSGAAASFQMDNMAPKILDEDYEPGFFIKHFIKDMKIAKEEAAEKGVKLPVLDLVLHNYEILEKEGYGNLGTQGLYRFYEDEKYKEDK